MALFAIDVRKYVLSRSHSRKHQHQHRRKRRPEGGNRTPRVASEPNTDGMAGGSLVAEGVGGPVDGIDGQTDDEEDEVCPPTCKVYFILVDRRATNVNSIFVGPHSKRFVGRGRHPSSTTDIVATNFVSLGSVRRFALWSCRC